MAREAIFELNTKPIQSGFPIVDGHGPILADIAQRQIEQFGQGVITGEDRAVFHDFSQTSIHRFDGIGGVDHLANLGRIVEKRDDVPPVSSPDGGDRGIGLQPVGLEFGQLVGWVEALAETH
jgi:hypothetical protein